MRALRTAFLTGAGPANGSNSGVGIFNASAVLGVVAAQPVSQVLAETCKGVPSVILRIGSKVLAAVPVGRVEELCTVIDQSPMFLGFQEYEDFQSRIREAAANVRAAMAPRGP